MADLGLQEFALYGDSMSRGRLHQAAAPLHDRAWRTGARPAFNALPGRSDFGLLEDLDAAIAVLVHTEGDLRLEQASRGFLEMMGLSRAAAIGRRVEDILLTELQLLLTQAVRQALVSEAAAKFTTTMRVGRGGKARVAFAAKALSDRVVSLEAQRLEEAPRVDDRRTAALFDQLSTVNGGMIYVYDLKGPLKLDLSSLLGYPPGHPLNRGEALQGLLHPEDVPLALAHRRALTDLPDGAFATVACRMKHIDGGWRWIEARERICARTRKGFARRILGFASDVSERRRLADSLALASKALLTAEAQERQRIARELHDSTAQHLVAIDLTLARLERRSGDNKDHADIARDIRLSLIAAHREVRTFSYLLHPPDLERLGFETTLRRFLDGFGLRTGLKIKLTVEGARLALGQVGELALFRVAQEALMNVHKHAKAKMADIRLLYAPVNVVLEVRDDGVGLTAAQIESLLAEQTGGVGISGMHARMEQIGGRLDLLPATKGLLVRAALLVEAH
jgi:signal transduction histidine kinase